jgi:hypothetical protein
LNTEHAEEAEETRNCLFVISQPSSVTRLMHPERPFRKKKSKLRKIGLFRLTETFRVFRIFRVFREESSVVDASPSGS